MKTLIIGCILILVSACKKESTPAEVAAPKQYRNYKVYYTLHQNWVDSITERIGTYEVEVGSTFEIDVLKELTIVRINTNDVRQIPKTYQFNTTTMGVKIGYKGYIKGPNGYYEPYIYNQLGDHQHIKIKVD